MKKAIWVGLIIVAAILVVIVSMTKDKSRSSSEAGDIKLGSILILSGEGASWGEASRNGINLAVKEINDSGGINSRNLSVIYEDDGSSPAKAISAFNKLVDVEGVEFIIGPNWSNTGTAIKDLAGQKKIIVISPSLGVKEFNESNKYLFNTWPHDFILSRNIADYAYSKGARNVALLGAQDVWVKDQDINFVERFKQLGGNVALTYEPLTTETDVRATLLKIRNDKAIDAIVMTTDGYSLTTVLAKQIRQLGVALPIYALTIDQTNLDNCQGACDGIFLLTNLTPTKAFSDKYVKTYNRQVEIGADSAYDAVMMLARAMKETNSTDTDKVADYLAKIKTYNGASGNLVSDGKRAFTKQFLVNRVVNGKPVLITE